MSDEVAVPDKDDFKIGEVCDIAGVKPFVLRYWETEFPQLAPAKGAGGQRTYSRQDVDLIMHIKRLLYEERFTVAGAKKRLSEEAEAGSRPAPVAKPRRKSSVALDTVAPDEVQTAQRVLGEVRRELEAIIAALE